MVQIQCSGLVDSSFSEMRAILWLLWVIIFLASFRSPGGLEVMFPSWHNLFSPENKKWKMKGPAF